MTISLSNIVKGYCVVEKSPEILMIDTNDLVIEKVRLYEAFLHEEEEELDGFKQGLSIPEVEALEEVEDAESIAERQAEELSAAQDEIKAMMEQASQEIQQMMEQAQRDAEVMKASAIEEAQKSGFDTGYQEGLQKAQDEFTAQEKKLIAREKELEKNYEDRVEKLEPLLVDKITGIYERVFKVDLMEQRSMVKNLVLDIMQNNDGNKNYLIHVCQEDYAEVNESKEEIMQHLAASCEVEIVVDNTLSKGACFIETNSGIYDCGIDTQLEELNRLLKVISYQ